MYDLRLAYGTDCQKIARKGQSFSRLFPKLLNHHLFNNDSQEFGK